MPGRTHAAENAVVVLESVRRAGGVLAERAELTIYAFIAASWIARQWRTRFGRDVTNCFNGVSMS